MPSRNLLVEDELNRARHPGEPEAEGTSWRSRPTAR